MSPILWDAVFSFASMYALFLLRHCWLLGYLELYCSTFKHWGFFLLSTWCWLLFWFYCGQGTLSIWFQFLHILRLALWLWCLLYHGHEKQMCMFCHWLVVCCKYLFDSLGSLCCRVLYAGFMSKSSVNFWGRSVEVLNYHFGFVYFTLQLYWLISQLLPGRNSTLVLSIQHLLGRGATIFCYEVCLQ